MTRLFLVLVIVLLCTAAFAETHPNDMPKMELDASYPRLSADELAASGFPDHLHAYWWPSHQPEADADGRIYGAGSFCSRKQLVEQDGLIIEPGRFSYGDFVTIQNQAYKTCDILPLLENLVWANHEFSQLLGLVCQDTLTVISPDNIPQYREQTGQDIWRLYKLKGNLAIIEPYGTLQARTLDGHGIFMLVADWLLKESLPQDLPGWLHSGLVHYLGQNGVHLSNYMLEFRPQGSVLYSPSLVNHILGQPVDPDPGRDREMFRRANYSAFLMTWDLVENNGGIRCLRDFLVLVSQNVDIDKASKKVYGLTMDELAAKLDPVTAGEPLGENYQNRRPAHPPQER
ncbi:MAG: hypothetical protein GY780_08090 [bacterium]|nr:hypothetical protein [bacterium]